MRDEHLVPQRQARPRRRQGRIVAGVVALVVIIGGALVGAKLLHHPTRNAQPPVSVTQQPPPDARTPADTVRAFFAALNHRDYLKAWRLDTFDHSSEDYRQFVSGYAGTLRSVVTILSTDGNVVSASLTAHQTNGTVQNYQGTYTVTNGVITGAHVLAVSG
jgi:hypothetical protein